MLEPFPLFPLGAVLFPGASLHLHIFETRYRRLVRRSIDSDPMFGVVLIRRGNEVGDQPETFDIGTTASLRRMVRHADGRFDLELVGKRRFRVLDQWWQEGCLVGTIEWLQPLGVGSDSEAMESLETTVRQEFSAYIQRWQRLSGRSIGPIELSTDPAAMAHMVSGLLPLDVRVRQQLLEIESLERYLQTLLTILQHESKLLEATGVGGARHVPQVSRFSAN